MRTFDTCDPHKENEKKKTQADVCRQVWKIRLLTNVGFRKINKKKKTSLQLQMNICKISVCSMDNSIHDA